MDSCNLLSDFSKPLFVTYDSVPKSIKNITSKVDECSLKIQWEAPNDQGFSLTGYKVDVKGKDNRFYEVKTCTKQSNPKDKATVKVKADPLSTTCFVSMRDLYAQPFMLRADDKINFRVQA
jgi:hypothetical protein